MSLEIALPIHIEQHLQTEWGNDLLRRAVEALAVEGYRAGILSLGEAAEMLDFPSVTPTVFSKSAAFSHLKTLKK